jgi:periplasmic protein CpxP/Spy
VVSKRMLQAQLDVARVLSPEQRKLMAERMNQHRAMMERHRSERESLK